MRAPDTRTPCWLASFALGISFALACATSPEPAPSPQEMPSESAYESAAFSENVAWNHLRALTEIGPRVSGTENAERARLYIVAQLEASGIEVTPEPEGESPPAAFAEFEIEPRNVLAVVPGESEDLVVLAAPYDSRHYESFSFVGANDGASGAALLLGLANTLSVQPLPYTTWFLFLDGEASRGAGPDESRRAQLFGSQLQAARFRDERVIPRIRLLVAFNNVCDSDLVIARDLGSHRPYREDFWNAAARLGYGEVFRERQGFETLVGSHLPFVASGLRRSVFISDSVFGGNEAPGLYAGTEDDTLEHCAAESLEIVGAVTLEALDVITRRLAKIDRFSSSPVARQDSEREAALPADEPAAESPGFFPNSSTSHDDGGADSGPSWDDTPADAVAR